MHLLTSYKSGALRALPQILPSGLYEAAARRGAPPRQSSTSRPTSEVPPISAIHRQFSEAGPQRTSSPLARPPYVTPPVSAQPTGTEWAISPQEKAQYDSYYATIDTENRGFITGDQAVGFFSDSRLPEEDLAQIWDLSDINSEGQLNREEFAVAMHLIRQQKFKKGPLPQTLPTNLIPPSMRRQPIAPPQSTAPTFDNAANITKPKSAADDLFGLDAFSDPAPQVAQSTGGSTAYTASSPPTQGSPKQPSVFKPFIPSSSFGQTMMTPQATGASAKTAPSRNRGPPKPQRQTSAMDDLLGDTDPDVSKRLTQETSELANLSNQVGTLTNQMQEVKSKRVSTDQDLSHMNSQKRDFEARLSQLRSAYEQEVREVKALEDRLALSKNETRRLQQDIAMLEGTHQDLQIQHRQVAGALDSDQRENASLKEKIRQITTEVNELKPQLEKMRSEARQQKGLVAINKKQLSTNEAERDKVRGDLEGASKEFDQATRELEESKLNQQRKSSIHSPGAAASHSPSTTSMNPFFRRTTTAPSEKTMSPPVTSPNHNAFDSLFGTSPAPSSPFSSPPQPAGPPTTSFRSESPNQPRELSQNPEPSGHSVRSSDDADVPTPSTSSPRSTHNESLEVVEPPPPPQSRQITSSSLPFRGNLMRSDSPNVSVKVSPPASRFGDASDVDTPTERQVSEPSGQNDKPQMPERTNTNPAEKAASGSASPFPLRTSSISSGVNVNRPTETGTSQTTNGLQDYGQTSAPPVIPGAFPGDATPPVRTPFLAPEPVEDAPKASHAPSETDSHNDVFTMAREQTPISTKDDFDSAFAGFSDGGKAPDKSSKVSGTSPFSGPSQPKVQGEFPPIQEFGASEESDSDSDRGFDDDFTPASPHRQDVSSEQIPGERSAASFNDNTASNLVPPRPPLGSSASDLSQPPTPDAQKSPPTYDQTVASRNNHEGGHRDSNQFPTEYGGLLPSREDPTSPHGSSQVPESAISSPINGDTGSNIFGGTSARERAASGTTLPPSQMPMSPGSTAAPYAYTQPPSRSLQAEPPAPARNAFDDFDDEFGDLSEAKEADDKGEDDFGTSNRDGFDEFNPTFDSPAPSKATTRPDDAFHDFESSISGSASTLQQPSQQQATTTSHDWDAIFAGMDDTSSKSNGGPSIPPKEGLSPVQAQGPIELAPSSSSQATSKPTLGRAVSAGTEHDDPILKRLTGMGYPREESLQALEKYDYNLNKVG